ncbi:MAG: substrate-binding domain-containing protein [Chitinophagaceae bacterium]
MSKKKIAIADIARELNISISTVSFILNGKAEEKRISKKLSGKVLQYVDEIGYVPNYLAQSLRTGKTKIIGLIVENIANTFFANVARLIEENAYKKGYGIFYCSSENETEKTKELIRLFQERQVDGFIITPTVGIQSEISSLLKNKSKFILFDRYFPELDTNYVVTDNYAGVGHLIERGYTKIGIVTLASDQTQMEERLAGYKKALSEKGLPECIKRVKYHDDPESITQDIVRFLKSERQLDALFFATNYIGVYGLQAINSLHLKIPVDLAIVSFDDHDLFRLHSPSITVIAQPVEVMSE